MKIKSIYLDKSKYGNAEAGEIKNIITVGLPLLSGGAEMNPIVTGITFLRDGYPSTSMKGLGPVYRVDIDDPETRILIDADMVKMSVVDIKKKETEADALAAATVPQEG